MAASYPNGYKNIVGKGEIARYEQFLLFPQCFLKACFPGASKGVIVWEWVNQHLYFINVVNLPLCRRGKVESGHHFFFDWRFYAEVEIL